MTQQELKERAERGLSVSIPAFLRLQAKRVEIESGPNDAYACGFRYAAAIIEGVAELENALTARIRNARRTAMRLPLPRKNSSQDKVTQNKLALLGEMRQDLRQLLDGAETENAE